ncbi:MAG: diguanylate cyclase [Candidatus Omnitrophica bacterium]|nr:diguanylate cyclase [Candidatus Omnitrophota bacterium]
MFSLIILTLLTISLPFQLRKIFNKRLPKINNNYEQLRARFDNLKSKNERLKKDNAILEKNVEETVALYDITREVCKFLEEDKVFESFRELINRYIRVGECKFAKSQADLSRYNDYTVFPLDIDKDIRRYLVTGQIREQDKERFSILKGQFLLGIKRAILYQKVQDLAITDSLTGIFSRRYLLERFKEELERSKKFKYNLSFLMIDIDRFKEYNDRYGHLVGDAILREASGAIKESIRQIDLIGRYGGEEFCVILNETDKYGARFVAERIRQAIEARDIRVYDEGLRITVSIGVAIFPQDAKDIEMLTDKADLALYRAKEAGRNRVCIYGNN